MVTISNGVLVQNKEMSIKPTILLVDDNPNNLKLLSKMLTEISASMIAQANGVSQSLIKILLDI